MILKILWLFFPVIVCAKDYNVLMSEVFEITIDPTMFNWTYEGRKDQFVYEATLANSPDLPSWIHYIYSEKHHCGFLYGVPPNRNQPIVPLEVVGLNKVDYDTRIENINIVIQEKLGPATYEVHMKIDNLNVDDMFEVDRMESLKEIFRSQLWKDSEEDLYVTFLESAIDMGARKPANPVEGEGVIVRLGSEVSFSSELLQLQEEIRPLYKVQPCPRNYKRTSVERFFRDVGFTLDWCSFRLIHKEENNNSAMHKSTIGHLNDDFNDEWIPISRHSLPLRSYNNELIITITVPMVLMLILVFVLTFILCLQHDDLIELSEHNGIISKNSPFQHLSLSNNTLGHEYSDSPNSTINRGVHCRPSPPPYVRPKFKPEI
ncbi:epsilon-sarcoglycan isoform X2 [Sitophilus oryzae]|uniref:Epsilon-sarcoglycan isoform X2 n=1 Tax=Sitophilus oryzae TaxID=7048 RepID=A0A6J2YYE3_SITOR|nr:epsilon-sarcoglycan isoform X2 [Sitophilus oryzae]